ncbi:nuclear transport factor 2 family protein [Sphingomonas sp.]|uniref:nuclear transport factor 2 family protein n=1 Tax=Sphingomonas sp. TaxID=28214 RepID=UPI0017C87CD7|nr:nuclear transport factor 2 family protein [Sphingomonas sp.]MBA3512429.1 nuclear transport factor 2 family protein [Sphingomonas sp.]
MRALSLMVATGLLAACNQQSTKQDNPEDQLRAANAQYDQALIEGDAAALNRYYTEDFQIIDDDGAVHDKKNQVQFMTKEVDLLNARGDDVKVTLLGPDSALVTGRFSGRYRYKGKEEDFTERYTSVWVRKDGQWRVRHEHTSLLPKSQPRVTG